MNSRRQGRGRVERGLDKGMMVQVQYVHRTKGKGNADKLGLREGWL